MAIEVSKYLPGAELEEVSDEVWKLLCTVDHEFVPPLSQRTGTAASDLRSSALNAETLWGGPVSYFESVMTQSVALARIDGVTAGIVSWKDNFYDELLSDEFNPCVRVTSLATHPDFILKGVATALIERVREEVKDSPAQWIVARNWSENSALRMFDRTGFKEVMRIPDHRGKGIDTIFLATLNG